MHIGINRIWCINKSHFVTLLIHRGNAVKKGEFIEDVIEFDRIYCMDCFEFIEKLPDESVNMVMTSPPYWGLRDYDVEGQIGLEPDFRDYIKKLKCFMNLSAC